MGQCYWNATHTLSKTAQNVFGNTIEFKHMTLCLVPEILDTIQVIMPVSKELWIIDPKVPKVLDIQDIVAFPTVGVDNAIRKNLLFNDWDLCSRGSIGNDLPINLSTTLKQPKYRDLTLWFSHTRQPLRLPLKSTFIDFSFSSKHLFGFRFYFEDNDFSKTVKIVSRCISVY